MLVVLHGYKGKPSYMRYLLQFCMLVVLHGYKGYGVSMCEVGAVLYACSFTWIQRKNSYDFSFLEVLYACSFTWIQRNVGTYYI